MSQITSMTVGLKEAAQLLHVHPKTVEDLIRDGSIPAGKVGRAWVMMTKDVLDYAQNVIALQTAARMREVPKASPPVATSKSPTSVDREQGVNAGAADTCSPKRVRKRATPKVTVAQQHPV